VSMRRSLIQHIRWLEKQETTDDEVAEWYATQMETCTAAVEQLEKQYGIAGNPMNYANKQRRKALKSGTGYTKNK